MSEWAKGKYAVQKIIRDNVILGMTKFGQTGWDCIEFAQATMQNADKIITMNCTGVDRIGWQGTKFDSVLGTRTDEWLEEQTWMFQVILKRTNEVVTASTITTQDVASMLITWFNGMGCDEFRRNRCANLRIDPSSVIVYNDDSDIYQKRAVFTMRLQVPKEYSYGQDFLDTIKPDIEPI